MNVQRVAGLAILLACNMLYSGVGWADSWRQALVARVSTEFDTNPAMSSTRSDGIWRGLFEPSYSLMGRTGESEITTGLAVQMSRSSNKSLSPDRDSPTVFLNWLRPSTAGKFGITSRYAEVLTSDAGGADSAGRVSASSTRVSRTVGGSWSNELSALSTVSADASYSGVSYKGAGIYQNYATQTVGLKYDYVMNERTTSFYRVSGNKYVPENSGPSSQRNDVALGMVWKSEYLDWTMQAGKSKVVSGNSVTQGSVETHYAGERNQLGVNVSRLVLPSGQGGFVTTGQIGGNWSYALSDYSNAGFDISLRKNYSSANSSNSTISGIWLDHNLNPLWKVRTYFRHRTNDVTGSAGVSSNILGFSFAYAYSDF